MERQLASIQRVSTVTPIIGADAIEQITVQGWNLIAKKGEFQPGSLCVFFELDSILPETEWSEFMRAKDFRVRTLRLGKFGVISQGLALPLTILPTEPIQVKGMYDDENREVTFVPGKGGWQEGENVTEILGVTKYEPKDSLTDLRIGGKTLKPFLPGVPKTDEIRLQSAMWVLERLQGQPYYITQKYDGTSFTAVYKEGEGLHVASRNCELEDDGNLYWEIAKRNNLAEKLEKFPRIVVQGEIVGPSIQDNRMGLKGHELYVFNAYNMSNGNYGGALELASLCAKLGLNMVKVHEMGIKFEHTLDTLVALAQGSYDNGHPQEGIVVRPMVSQIDPILGQLSFKVINVDFLLKVGQ